jgi:hypothetical protein
MEQTCADIEEALDSQEALAQSVSDMLEDTRDLAIGNFVMDRINEVTHVDEEDEIVFCRTHAILALAGVIGEDMSITPAEALANPERLDDYLRGVADAFEYFALMAEHEIKAAAQYEDDLEAAVALFAMADHDDLDEEDFDDEELDEQGYDIIEIVQPDAPSILTSRTLKFAAVIIGVLVAAPYILPLLVK